MRYQLIIHLDDGTPVKLGGNCVPEVRALAERMTHADDHIPYWEIIDSYNGELVESSETKHERKERKPKR